MTSQRAQFIITQAGLFANVKFNFKGRYGSNGVTDFSQDGMNEKEVAHVRQVWQSMPGNKSFMDALRKVSKTK